MSGHDSGVPPHFNGARTDLSPRSAAGEASGRDDAHRHGTGQTGAHGHGMGDIEARIAKLEEVEAIRRQFVRLNELFDKPYDADGLVAMILRGSGL